MTTTSIEFTVKMSEFKRKLRATTHATADDPTMPILNLIKVTVESNQVMLIATDRYKIIATRQNLLTETSVTGTVLLNLKALKYLGMMGLSTDDKLTIRATQEGTLELEAKEETLTIHQTKETYPRIETLLHEHIEAEATGQILGFAPKHLDDVVKSFKSLYPRESLIIQGTLGKKTASPAPAMIYGNGVDDWVAMLMPMRIGNAADATKAARKAFASLTTPGKEDA